MRAAARLPPGGARQSSFATVVLAALATILFLQWARTFLIPLALAVVVSFAFNPVVRAVRRYGVSRYTSSATIVLSMWAVGIGMLWMLQDGASAVASQLPIAAERIANAVESWRREGGDPMQRMREAAKAIERATGDAPPAAAPADPRRRNAQPPVAVEMREPPWHAWLLSGSGGLLVLVGQLVTVTFLVLFLLGSGETLKRKLMRFVGPSIGRRKNLLRMLNAIGEQIQSSLFVLLTTNVLFGLTVWITFRLLGIANAEVWGAVGAFAHFVPYLGSGLIAAAGALAAWMQFESVPRALSAWIIVIVAATLIGTLIATWMQSRMSRMDAAIMFVGLLFWGWLWGVAGLLLAMPILAMGKAVCDHVEPLKPLADLLGTVPERRASARGARAVRG